MQNCCKNSSKFFGLIALSVPKILPDIYYNLKINNYRFSHTLSTNLMLDSRNRAWGYCLQYQALLLEYITLVIIVIQYFGGTVPQLSTVIQYGQQYCIQIIYFSIVHYTPTHGSLNLTPDSCLAYVKTDRY